MGMSSTLHIRLYNGELNQLKKRAERVGATVCDLSREVLRAYLRGEVDPFEFMEEEKEHWKSEARAGRPIPFQQPKG